MKAVAQAELLCTWCKRTLPTEAFSPDTRHRRGYSSHCKECRAATRRQWRRENREVYNAVARERMRAKRADPVRREVMKEQWRVWSRTPKGERYKRRSTANRRGEFDCRATQDYAEHVLALDPCSYCGGPGGTVDHIEPLVAGGSGTADNLTGACHLCNSRKCAMPLLGFMLRKVEHA